MGPVVADVVWPRRGSQRPPELVATHVADRETAGVRTGGESEAGSSIGPSHEICPLKRAHSVADSPHPPTDAVHAPHRVRALESWTALIEWHCLQCHSLSAVRRLDIDPTPIHFGVLTMSTLLIGFGLGIFSAALLLVVVFDLKKAPTRRRSR